MQSSNIPTAQASILFLLAAGGVLPLLFIDGQLSNTTQLYFLFLNGVLFFYLLFEVSRLFKKEKWRFLLNPPVLTSLFLFMGSYLFPNLRHMGYFDWQHTKGFSLLVPDPYKWMNLAILAVILAAFAMWRGYYSKVPVRLSKQLRLLLTQKRLLRKGININIRAVLFFTAIAAGSFVLKVKLGIFGYSSDADSLVNTRSIAAFIKLGTDCGPLILLVLSLAVFSDRSRHSIRIWLLFYLVLFGLIISGFLSGFKSQVVMPIIITGFGFYTARHKVPFKLILLTFLMMALSYQVIEPFRQMRYTNSSFENRSISSIAANMLDVVINDSHQNTYSSTWEKFIARNDLLTFTAVSMAFKDTRGVPENGPAFIKNILISPLLAFIPRFIWKDKALQNAGYWFNVNILGTHQSTLSAVAMGPVSYCYFGGGYLLIFIVFWLIGFIQRVTYNTFVDNSLGGWIIYLALLPTLVKLHSNIGAMFAGFFRIIPFAILVQYFLIRKSKIVKTLPKKD